MRSPRRDAVGFPRETTMGWFTKLCRQTGLIVHDIIKPVDEHTQRREVSRKTEERKVDDSVTLRRTTIDEVEIKQKRRNNDV